MHDNISHVLKYQNWRSNELFAWRCLVY